LCLFNQLAFIHLRRRLLFSDPRLCPFISHSDAVQFHLKFSSQHVTTRLEQAAENGQVPKSKKEHDDRTKGENAIGENGV
jgi:hypothetical protein